MKQLTECNVESCIHLYYHITVMGDGKGWGWMFGNMINKRVKESSNANLYTTMLKWFHLQIKKNVHEGVQCGSFVKLKNNKEWKVIFSW